MVGVAEHPFGVDLIPAQKGARVWSLAFATDETRTEWIKEFQTFSVQLPSFVWSKVKYQNIKS
jgi:hypothetical protein